MLATQPRPRYRPAAGRNNSAAPDFDRRGPGLRGSSLRGYTGIDPAPYAARTGGSTRHSRQPANPERSATEHINPAHSNSRIISTQRINTGHNNTRHIAAGHVGNSRIDPERINAGHTSARYTDTDHLINSRSDIEHIGTGHIGNSAIDSERISADGLSAGGIDVNARHISGLY